jgi:hypothetical protein
VLVKPARAIPEPASPAPSSHAATSAAITASPVSTTGVAVDVPATPARAPSVSSTTAAGQSPAPSSTGGAAPVTPARTPAPAASAPVATPREIEPEILSLQLIHCYIKVEPNGDKVMSERFGVPLCLTLTTYSVCPLTRCFSLFQ